MVITTLAPIKTVDRLNDSLRFHTPHLRTQHDFSSVPLLREPVLVNLQLISSTLLLLLAPLETPDGIARRVEVGFGCRGS